MQVSLRGIEYDGEKRLRGKALVLSGPMQRMLLERQSLPRKDRCAVKHPSAEAFQWPSDSLDALGSDDSFSSKQNRSCGDRFVGRQESYRAAVTGTGPALAASTSIRAPRGALRWIATVRLCPTASHTTGAFWCVLTGCAVIQNATA